ncbi:MAG: SDR family oxidoreductase [Chloroflexi bacterium]|nr:MAG: SDR family oxidoreductase [Chloroflexota bacterium]
MRVNFDISGKKALVAGGAGDLGSAIVTSLNAAGVEVVVLDCIENLPSWIEARCHPGNPPLYGVKTNLMDRQDLHRGFQEALAILGNIDILVNCQGIQRRYPPEEFPIEVWDEVIEINLTSVFTMTQLVGRQMLNQGWGKIINIASMQSFSGGVNIPAYAASKGGVAILTKSFANAWASRGINVNAIAPGYFDTKMTAGVKNNAVRYEQILARIPAGRWGLPEDICGPLLFLASPASDYVNGVTFPVDGGMLGT